MMLPIFLLFVIISSIDSIYQSTIQLTSTGFEYQPNNNIQLLSTNPSQTQLLCSLSCNYLSSCRIFDYDSVSKRCRLFEGDSTTGSIISSSSSTSVVGTVYISSTLYSFIHNQPCQSCQQYRYEVCSVNTGECQCPDHTYWDGAVCALQLFENQTCGQENSCRSDLDLICTTDCYGYSPTCLASVFDNITLSSMPFGITVAGGCNGNSSTNQTILHIPASIVLDSNNTLYVGDNANRLLAFDFNNRTGLVLGTFASWARSFFLDNRTSNIYMTFWYMNRGQIWPTNQTIPPSGITYSNCSLYWLFNPCGIVVDSVGNIYISSWSCNWVTKWAPNATSSTLVAGSSLNLAGTDGLSLDAPYGLALDEPNSFLYVADRNNDRIQRFVLGSPIGVTIAGGNGQGSAANQLYHPTEIYLSRLDGSIYITDYANNRIQNWQMNATVGTTFAGSPIGIAGNTPYLLYCPYGLAIDYEENYLYVSDSNNSRIQRFYLH